MLKKDCVVAIATMGKGRPYMLKAAFGRMRAVLDVTMGSATQTL